MNRNFFPDSATPFEPRKSAATKQQDLVNRGANRALSSLRTFGAGPRAGQESSPTDKRNQAALMALRERAKTTGMKPYAPESLLINAELQEEEERQALAQASGDIKAQAMRKVGTLEAHNPYGDFDNTTALDMHSASALANNMSLGKPTPMQQGGGYGSRGTSLSGQGVRQLAGSLGQQQYGQHQAYQKQMQAADGEAQQIREQQHMQTEGDAWLLEQRRKAQAAQQQPMPAPAAQPPALTALAGRR